MKDTREPAAIGSAGEEIVGRIIFAPALFPPLTNLKSHKLPLNLGNTRTTKKYTLQIQLTEKGENENQIEMIIESK